MVRNHLNTTYQIYHSPSQVIYLRPVLMHHSNCKVHDLWVTLTIRMGQMNLLFHFSQEIEEVEVIHLLQSDGL